MSNKPAEKQLTAAQRLDQLEQAMNASFQLNDNFVKDLMAIKEALRLLDNKVNAITQASRNGEEMNDVVLSRIMVENNCAELERKVSNLIASGLLVSEDQVSENAFVVGRELSNDDTVLNARLQFALKALQPELQAKLIGTKPGDHVQIKEDLKFHVTATYKIQTPQPEGVPSPDASPVLETDPKTAPTEPQA